MFYVSSQDSALLRNIEFATNAVVLCTDVATEIHKNEQSNFWSIIKVEDNSSLASTISKVKAIKSAINNDNIFVAPVFGDEDKPLATSEYFYVKVKNVADDADLKKVAEENDMEIVEAVPYMDGWYVLKAPTTSNGLQMSNTFFETGLFADVDPAFIFNLQTSTCTSEPNESNQWGLNKMNMCEAWGITKGSSNIVVAVLDQGVDKSHKEFANNYSSLSYDIHNQSSPSVVRGNHGTHVGGIIGANHNGIQIAGIAPQTTLLLLSHAGKTFKQKNIFQRTGADQREIFYAVHRAVQAVGQR